MSHSFPLFASFALPFLALGAAAAAASVPVLIHLLSRQRHQVVRWAAIRFLMSAQKRSRRRIDRWLLLSLRVLALLLPLAAMCAATDWAEKVWQWLSPGEQKVVSNLPRTHHVFVLDGSVSMTAVADGGTRFDKGVETIRKAVKDANAGDGFSLFFAGTSAVTVVPGPTNDKEKFLAELAQLKPTHGPCDAMAALTPVAETVARSPRSYPRRQVTFVTDARRSTWASVLPTADKMPDMWKRIISPADNPPRTPPDVAVIDVAGSDVPNMAVTDVSLANPLGLVDAPNAVLATVRNFSTGVKRGVRVELLVGRPSAAGTDTTLAPVKDVTLEVVEPNKPATVTFPLEDALRFRYAGVHLLQVKLSSSDDLTADDTRTIAVTVREAIPVMVVNAKTADKQRFGTGDDVLAALEPPGERIPGNAVKPRVATTAEFAEPALSDLSAIDCVFLCDVPTVTPATAARLETVLKRGGGVVIILGPNAAANLDTYNRVLFDNGKGLLPGKLLGVKSSAPGEADYRFFADDKAYTQDPLAAFRVGNARTALADVPFGGYVKMDAPADGRARRILSFVPANPAKVKPEDATEKPDPAVVEWTRFRGRVAVVCTATTKEWGEWPSSRSFLPFVHELTRFVTTSPDRHTLGVGDTIEETVPGVAVGLSATITTPDDRVETVPVVATEDGGVIRFSETNLSGLYKVRLAGRKESVFAVNTPDSAGGSVSDLTRADPDAFRKLGPTVQIVTDPADLKFTTAEGETILLAPKSHGPTIARWLVTLALFILALEVWLAWRVGPSRAVAAGVGAAAETGRPGMRWVWVGIGALPLLIAGALLATVLHAELTGQPLGFLPESARYSVESSLGVPRANAGEGTRWRLESSSAYTSRSYAGGWITDGRIVVTLVSVLGVVVAGFYWLERRAAGKLTRVILPLSLRLGAILLLGFVLLPQLRLAFEREGWPDVAVIIDSSESMSTADDYRAPAIRAKAAELAKLVPEGTTADRFALAKVLLTRPNVGWLDTLISKKQVKVHIFTLAEQPKLLTNIDEAADIPAAREALWDKKLIADGPSSRLGDGVQTVLKNFKGGGLTAAIVFTDGQTTAGAELGQAGRVAAQAGVPLYLVGFGESQDYPDLALSDLKAEDVVLKGDQLVFEARLSVKGPNPPSAVPVILWERKGEELVNRREEMVQLDPAGKPVPVKLAVTPTEPGEKSFVIEVRPLPGEVETGNNKLDKVVLVTDSKELKVLYIEGYARYEYRFVKAVGREIDGSRDRPVKLGVILLDGSPFYHKQEDAALEAFPTKAELDTYDAVILGDIDPAKIERSAQFFTDLADFVRVKGGGLLVIAGEHSAPHKLFDTPLADLLPILPTDAAVRGGPPAPTPDATPLTEGYRLRPTPLGRSHPLFRFTPDDAANAKLLDDLKPFFWTASGYRKKPTAEVLATHPTRPADGDVNALHPLVVQQFYGKGRVMFYGFDETWRWRFRNEEERFGQFWTQTVRALARTRVSKVELRTDRPTAYRKGDPIRLTLRYPDDAKIPPTAATVKVTQQRKPLRMPGGAVVGDSETQTLELTKVEGTRGEYQGLVTRTPEGEYQFQVADGTPLPGDTKPRAEARVLPPPGERDRVEMNRPELERAATESRGKFYTLADADKLIDDLPDPTRLPLDQPVKPISVWDHALLFALLTALLAIEWWVRRRERLV